MILSLATITFIILYMINKDNLYYNVIWQGTLGLLMLVNGAEAILLMKKRSLGVTLIGVSAVVFSVMAYTVITGIQTNAFK